MKKKIKEPEFIGGQGPLTKEEEIALRKFFTEEKMKLLERKNTKLGSERNKKPSTTK